MINRPENVGVDQSRYPATQAVRGTGGDEIKATRFLEGDLARKNRQEYTEDPAAAASRNRASR